MPRAGFQVVAVLHHRLIFVPGKKIGDHPDNDRDDQDHQDGTGPDARFKYAPD